MKIKKEKKSYEELFNSQNKSPYIITPVISEPLASPIVNPIINSRINPEPLYKPITSPPIIILSI